MNTTVPTDAPSIFDPIRSLSQLRQQAIIRPNNPPVGIAGFLFDIPLEDRVSLRSAITDSFVEDNTAIQDQIALSPEEISVRGLVAELVQTTEQLKKLLAVQNPLGATPGMEVRITEGQAQKMKQAAAAKAGATVAIAPADSLYSIYTSQAPGPPSQTKQSRAFGYFYQLWKGRQMFSVETPWGFFTSMAITSVDVIQPEESRGQSELAITFKKIRIAQEVTVNLGQLAGRAEFQQAPEVQNGNAGTKDVPPDASWLSQLGSLFNP